MVETVNIVELEKELRRIRDEAGWGNFDYVIKKLMRERVNPEREKRKQPSPAKKQKWFDRQHGICACGCGGALLIPARLNHADHFNPDDTQDFNGMRNMRLLLPQHNLEKSDRTPHEVAKQTGRTVATQIEESGLNTL